MDRSMSSLSVLECVASGALDVEAALRWLSNQVEDDSSALPEQLRGVTRYQFAAEFLHALRLQTDPLVVPPASVTPRKTSSAANILVHHGPSPSPTPTPVSAERRRRRPTSSAGGGGGGGGTRSTPPTRPANVTPRTNCLGDYMRTVKHTHSGKKRGNKNTSMDSTDSIETNSATNMNTSTPINVTNIRDTNVYQRDTSSDSDRTAHEHTSDRQSVTPVTLKSFESRLFYNSDIRLQQSPNADVTKSGQTQFNTNTRKSGEIMTQMSKTNNNNKSSIRRVNVTTIDATESSPSVFNFKAVAEIDPSDNNQFKYNQNKHYTPINIVGGSNKCKSTHKVNNELNSVNISPSIVKNGNKDKVNEKFTPEIANNTVDTNKSKEMSSDCDTPNTPATHARSDASVGPEDTCSSCDTPLRVTPTTDSIGLSQCSGVSSVSGVSRVGMRPRALAAAFDQPKVAHAQVVMNAEPSAASTVSSPLAPAPAHQTPAACDVSDARALEACGRLYAAILDNNLVDTVPNEIAHLGSLVSMGRRVDAHVAPAAHSALIRSPQDAAHLARTALHHTALLAMVTAQPRATRDRDMDHTSHLSVAQYDAERDGMTAFNHPHSFSAHKRQRDAFNHLYRWWRETNGSEPPSAESSVRARARAIVGVGRGEINMQHLAALIVTHLIHDTQNTMQESKLSKLRRRLTAPSNACPALPHEEFYREVLTCCESVTWHQHVSAALANALANALDVDKLPSTEELCARVRLASVLGRLMGLLAAGGSAAGGSDRPPSHNIVDNAVTAKQYSQPCVDLRALLTLGGRGRLVVGLPFLHHYLSQLDYSTMRQPYYTRVLRGLRCLYRRLTDVHLTATRTYLTWIMCSTFALGTFPPHLLPCSALPADADDLDHDPAEWVFALDMENTLDGAGTVDASVLHECIPSARTILGTPAASSGHGTGVTRHVTPVSLPPDPEHAVKQKERQLQSRLEQHLLQTSGSAARRALEVCVERATAHGVTCLTRDAARAVSHARDVTQRAARDTHTQMSLQTVFRSALSEALARCVDDCTATVKQHAARAVSALLEHHGAADALAAVAGRRAGRGVTQWARDTYTPEVICPDMGREVTTALCTPRPAPSNAHCAGSEGDEHRVEQEACSAAEALITLKECVCAVLEAEGEGELVDVGGALQLATAAVRAGAGAGGSSPTTTSAWQQAMLHLTIDLCTALVCRQPAVITTSFLLSMESIWTNLSPPCYESTNEQQAFAHNCKSTIQRRQQTPQTRDCVASTNEKSLPINCDIEPTNQHQDVSRESMDPANEELAPTPPTSDDDDGNRVQEIVIDTAFVPTHDTQTHKRALCTCAVASAADVCSGDGADVWRRVVCVRNIALLATAPTHLHTQVWSSWRTLVSYIHSSGRLPSRSLSAACLTLAHADHRPHVLDAVKWTLRAVRGAPLHAHDTHLVDVLHECLATTE